jgi:serine/threonine-protein kinase RsbW
MLVSQNIASDLKVLPEFVNSVLDKVRTLPFNQEQLHDIRLCLEEALVNAVKHGNNSDSRLFVQLAVESSDKSLAITVTDQGKGFDYRSLPDPTAPGNLEKLSGRGVFLILNRMDKVEFSRGGSSITMTKFFQNGEKK